MILILVVKGSVFDETAKSLIRDLVFTPKKLFIVNTSYRLHFSCPEGMKPNYDHAICERNYENHFTGTWKLPNQKEFGQSYYIHCSEIIKQCEDLDEKYYDETVNVRKHDESVHFMMTTKKSENYERLNLLNNSF